METIQMNRMNWPDIKTAIENGYATVVLAIGSTEQHGPHLPTMTDTRIGDELARRVALKLGHTLQANSISIGCSSHHFGFPGTISLRGETLKMVILDYIDSLVRSRFRRIILVPTHGGNFSTVQEALKEARNTHPGTEIIGIADFEKILECLVTTSAEFGVTANESGAHAGENETSIMMALEQALVLKNRFAPGYVGSVGEGELKLVWEQGMASLTEIGVLGDPRKASAEKGEAHLDRLTGFVVQEIKKQLS